MSQAHEDAKVYARGAIKEYAEKHDYFTGGDMLAFYRDSKLPGSELDWRNRWGALIQSCSKLGWYKKAGRIKPTTRQSHTEYLTLWASNLYQGTINLSPHDMSSQISSLRKAVMLRKITLEDALWKAFDLGSGRKE